MTKVECEQIVKDLDEDKRMDLLMYLAEEFGVRVKSNEGEDITYYLATDGNFPTQTEDPLQGG